MGNYYKQLKPAKSILRKRDFPAIAKAIKEEAEKHIWADYG